MDDFLNYKLTTSNGSKIHIIKILGIASTGDKLYEVYCSKCSKDKELFPDVLITRKTNMLNGSLPCGCSKAPHWSVDQLKVRFARRCRELSVVFVEDVDFEQRSRAIVRFKIKDNDRLYCRSLGNFLNDNSVKELINKRPPKSSKDKIEKNLKDELAKVSGAFLKFCSDKVITTGYFEWLCKDGHKCRSENRAVVKRGARCGTCSKLNNSWGFIPSKALDVDLLYVIHFKPLHCIKVGRTIDMDRRLSELIKASGCSLDDIEILKTVKGIHKNIFPLEQRTHKVLRSRGYQSLPLSWTGECFDESCKELVLSLV